MGVSSGNLFKENYRINGRPFTATADFDKEILVITGRAFLYECDLKEYTGFEGDMLTFIRSKVEELVKK